MTKTPSLLVVFERFVSSSTRSTKSRQWIYCYYYVCRNDSWYTKINKIDVWSNDNITYLNNEQNKLE